MQSGGTAEGLLAQLLGVQTHTCVTHSPAYLCEAGAWMEAKSAPTHAPRTRHRFSLDVLKTALGPHGNTCENGTGSALSV